MTEKNNDVKQFLLKIDVAESSDKSFLFKIEGNIPVSIQDAIKTAITGIKTVGPNIAQSISEIGKQAAQQTEEAKKKFNFSVQNAKVLWYFTKEQQIGHTTISVQDAANELELTPEQIQTSYEALVKDGLINQKKQEEKKEEKGYVEV